MSARLDSLVGNDYTIQRFADLPNPYQLAIIWFMAVDGDAWDRIDLSELPFDDPQRELTDLLPKYIEHYGDTLFGSAIVSSGRTQEAVMRDPDIAEDFASWEQYHSAYLAVGVPMHPEHDRWPVILSGDDSETLRDGWHRFHSYVRDGAVGIPAVFFPDGRHLDVTQKQSLITFEEAARYIDGLAKRDLLFHFEDDAADCLRGHDLTTDEVEAIRHNVKKLFSIEWSAAGYDCPFDYMLTHH